VNTRSCLLVSALALSLAPSVASAGEPSVAVQTQRRVETGLLKPLATYESEQSRFSRARLPPAERRVRVLDPAPNADKAGRPFVSFAVDVRYGSEWYDNDIVGCVYPASGKIFVKRGDAFRPAELLYGKKGDVVADVCVAAAGKG
jgi:hypothetical protein